MNFDLALSPGRRPTTMVRKNWVGGFLRLLNRSDCGLCSQFGTVSFSCFSSIFRFLRLVLLLHVAAFVLTSVKALAAVVYHFIGFRLCLPIFRYSLSQSVLFLFFSHYRAALNSDGAQLSDKRPGKANWSPAGKRLGYCEGCARSARRQA